MRILVALLGAYLLFKLQEYLYRRFWKKNLDVNISFSEESAMEGDQVSLIETVTNRKWLPLPVIQVKFMTSKDLIFADNANSRVSDHYYRNDMLSVIMYQKLTRTLTFRCSRRGFYSINRMDVVCSDLFLSSEYAQGYDMDIHLYVYPKLTSAAQIEVPFQTMLGTVLTKRFINEDPFEFRNIREYQTYDNLKSINWKASARTGSLKVNVNDYTSSAQVKILLNLEPGTLRIDEDLQEESIRIAATLASLFIKQGIPVALITNGRDVITLEEISVSAGTGNNHVRTLMESLSRIDTLLHVSPFVPTVQREFFHALDNDFIILISINQKEELQQVLLSQQQSNKEFSWILPINREMKTTVCEDLLPRVHMWKMFQLS